MLKILTPDQINKPRTPHRIESGGTEKDWHGDQELLGGTDAREVLCPDRNYVPYITEYELQRNNNFDSYTCVIQAYWNGYQCIAKKKYGIVLNESKRKTAKDAGCVPGRGSNVNTVGETIRKIDSVDDSVYPTMTEDMTEAEFYQPLPALDKYYNFLCKGWLPAHEWLPRASLWVAYSTPQAVYEALQYSPVVVSVDGDYRFNPDGELQYGYLGPYIQYTHDVLVVGAEMDGDNLKYFLVLDSENPEGLMKVEKIYRFGYAKNIYLKYSNMMKLYKKKGDSAIYALTPQNTLVPFMDGVVSGGEYFKTVYGVEDYSKITRIKDEKGDDWDELPFPLDKWGLTSVPYNQ
jgi:hypothetical protein